MRIIAVSDTHGRNNEMVSAVLKYPRADLILHLGDGFRDLEDVREIFPEKTITGVCGNCDFVSAEPPERFFCADGPNVFMTHGHHYHVKQGLEYIAAHCRKIGATLCFFGHTHRPVCEERDGVWLLNPGACHGPDAMMIVAETSADGSVSCRLERVYP